MLCCISASGPDEPVEVYFRMLKCSDDDIGDDDYDFGDDDDGDEMIVSIQTHEPFKIIVSTGTNMILYQPEDAF